MDLEKLKKLVRLANNNPNDNEANLAARRVCKMLEEADFKLGVTPIPPTDSRSTITYDDIGNIYKEYARYEQPSKSETQYDVWVNGHRFYYDFIKGIYVCSLCSYNVTMITSHMNIPFCSFAHTARR